MFKLKAVIKETKEIVEVASINFEEKFISYSTKNKINYCLVSFEEVILLKSTGLYDSKGVEIFEGDMVKRGSKVYVIDNSNYRMVAVPLEEYYGKYIFNYRELEEFKNDKDTAIIGNIHTKEKTNETSKKL